MGRNRECEAHVHAATITLDWSVDEFLDFGERDNLIELRLDLLPRHAENRTVEINVFSASQFRMEAGADFQQARDTSVQLDMT